MSTQADPRAPIPKGNAWAFRGCFTVDGELLHHWANGTIVALASWYAGVASHHTKIVVPTRHLSISDGGRRASDDVIRGVLADFDFEGAEEDNHSPGLARHFWLDDGRALQPECECKSTEETIVEPDGYRWQRERKA